MDMDRDNVTPCIDLERVFQSSRYREPGATAWPDMQ